MDAICTVLLISYNHYPYISHAIESVLEQETEYDIDIHIFDDGSTDGTQEIIKEYIERYPNRISAYLSPENRGAQANIWSAFESVITKYCIILECDDYWCDKRKLQMQISALERNAKCSFCGHDSLLAVLDENAREYEDGAHACTAEILHEKTIFSLNDFDPIDTGGYIPYPSARLIRTECLHLDKIKYKESILFDFTQFYYLLLQGDYYYIDRVMSVYQRAGTGICSSKHPLDFLNTFLANAIDFNKETNGCIADKIFRDCQLQISFRLQLSKSSPRLFSVYSKSGEQEQNSITDNDSNTTIYSIVNSLNDDEYYFLCNGGIGFTMTVCGLKSALEAMYHSRINLVIRKEHEFVMQMYQEKNYLISDWTKANLDALSEMTPNPQKGRLYICHPYAHREQINYYLPMLQMGSSRNFFDWIKDFFFLPEDTRFELPKYTEFTLSEETAEKLGDRINFSNTILLFPESFNLPRISMQYWKSEVTRLKQQGYFLVSCVKEPKNTIAGTAYFPLTLDESISLAARCHSVYSVRSGICDALYFLGDKLHVVYSSHSAFFLYGMEAMYGKRGIHEEIVLDPVLEPTLLGPQRAEKAYLFGFIPVPDIIYRLYLRHKNFLWRFKRFIKWK